jgi:beta-hydroxylase
VFYESDSFEFTSRLEDGWQIIRHECDCVRQTEWIVWPQPRLGAGNGWTIFGLFVDGQRLDENCRRCPQTACILESVPGITMAGFSLLTAGTRIRPHKGITDRVLRCHLGLTVPNSCGLCVAGEIRHWQTGKCLVFDDTVEHSAWNDSKENRIVLLVDFLKSEMELGQSLPPSIAAALNHSSSGRSRPSTSR